MTSRDIIGVVGDMEIFIDRLLSHAKEEHCTHSINDLLEEFFDNKNSYGELNPTTGTEPTNKSTPFERVQKELTDS